MTDDTPSDTRTQRIDPATGRTISDDVLTHQDGTPLRAFHTAADAEAQAKRLGKGHYVEAVGVAFAVRHSDDVR